ncbi:hypothetical protein ACGFU4_36300 [Streptomyces sp. NPDC048511]|uniref:hypothetical protein n=1 Tax=Streptomyces sp. NPDC048511 TaxID=3365562 RepID=UPI00371FBAF6
MTQPQPANTRPLRRGRPLEGHAPFEEPTRALYLDLIRHGMRLGDAATQLGISRATPTRHGKVDREFAAALREARTVGQKVRQEGVPHDEYRYNVLKCRCPKCRAAATRGRANRRTTDDQADTDEAEVTPIRPVVVESSTSFLLARAS